MTYEDFIHYVHHPETLTEEQIPVLKELVARYPYFGVSWRLYLKALRAVNSIYYSQELKQTALRTPDRRNLYFFIHPEEHTTPENKRKDRSNAAGSYFDMLETLENKGENNRQSLQSLAERLKAARVQLHEETVKKNEPVSVSVVETTTPELVKIVTETHSEMTESSLKKMEEEARNCIKEKKYQQAIEILKELNLNNPKKNIYFADQIRFLEKIIKN